MLKSGATTAAKNARQAATAPTRSTGAGPTRKAIRPVTGMATIAPTAALNSASPNVAGGNASRTRNSGTCVAHAPITSPWNRKMADTGAPPRSGHSRRFTPQHGGDDNLLAS